MKTTLLNMVMLCMFIAAISSCKKDKAEKKDNGLSDKINKIISQDIIDDLQKRGMTINTGNAAVNIEGIVQVSPCTLLSSYGSDDPYYPGYTVADYKFRFYNQSGDEVKLDYKNQIGDSGSDYTSYLSGNGNHFTLFTQMSGIQNGIAYKHVAIASGEKTADGIKNFQYAFVLTEKNGDENNYFLMPVGKSRIFFDADYIAESTSIYRQGPANGLNNYKTLSGAN